MLNENSIAVSTGNGKKDQVAHQCQTATLNYTKTKGAPSFRAPCGKVGDDKAGAQPCAAQFGVCPSGVTVPLTIPIITFPLVIPSEARNLVLGCAWDNRFLAGPKAGWRVAHSSRPMAGMAMFPGIHKSPTRRVPHLSALFGGKVGDDKAEMQRFQIDPLARSRRGYLISLDPSRNIRLRKQRPLKVP